MNTWVLVIIYGITGFGHGGLKRIEFPDKASCYESLAAMRISGINQQAGDDDEQIIAFCKPNIEE